MKKAFYFFLPLLLLAAATGSYGFAMKPLRGVTVSNIKESDVEALKNYGVSVIRLTFNQKPLMSKTPPYAMNTDALKYLDDVLKWCQERNIRVIIDPHTVPGTRKATTTSPRDQIWSDGSFHEKIIEMWEEIAKRYKGYGDVIAGFDLLNEPNVPRTSSGVPINKGAADWNMLAARIVKAIRKHDKIHPVIIEPIASRRIGRLRVYPLDGPKYFVPPDDDRVIFSFHMYEPAAFAHQGVNEWPENVTYPGMINGKYWDKNTLKEVVQPIREVQKKFNVPIYVGEFSATRWTGDAGNQYIKDLISIFEEYGWSWTYHKFRGSDIWDPEKSNTDKNDKTNYGNTPRMKILTEYFKK